MNMLVVMLQHFMPAWWIAKDSLGIVALGIFNNVTSLVKLDLKYRCVPPYITLDLEVRDSSLARCVVSLGTELYFTLALSIQVYKWVRTCCRGNTLRWTSIPSRRE